MKNIFVLFSPGTGGNHLANLLSTDIRFAERSKVQDYLAHVKNNAHTSNIQNLNLLDIALLSSSNNVLCGHFGEYHWLSLSGLLKKFTGRQIFILEVPDRDTFAWARYKSLYPMNNYFYEEQRSLYTIDMVRKVFNEHDIVSLPCELLFDSDLTKLFRYISKESDLDLHHQKCQQMHTIWYKRIEESINQNNKKG